MDFSERFRMVLRLWKYRLREERDSIAFMRRQALSGCTVIDVGANKGIYSYWMSRQVGPRGKVVAFEPQRELRPHLDALKQAFGLQNLEIVSKGLSSQAGVFTMVRDKVGALGASLRGAAEEADQPPAGTQSIAVEVLTLDAFCAARETGRIAFIKCDVEGHELAVFQGAEKTLERHRPVLLFECDHQEAQRGELFRYLEERDFEGGFIERGSWHPARRFAEVPYRKPGVWFRNYMFVSRRTNRAVE